MQIFLYCVPSFIFKKKAAIDRYLTLHKNGDTGTLTNMELRSFEHFACAMDTTQISTIQAAVYG